VNSVADKDGGCTRCESCSRLWRDDELTETIPEVLASSSWSVSLCPTCLVVYEYTFVDSRCFRCGTLFDSTADSHRFEIGFPFTDSDGPQGMVAGEMCGECAQQVGLDVLYTGIRSRAEPRSRLVQTLIDQEKVNQRPIS